MIEYRQPGPNRLKLREMLRENPALTQSEAARALGVSPQCIGIYARKDHLPFIDGRKRRTEPDNG